MTDEILQSDIDLARSLIAQRLPDREIIASLALRRISPVRAEPLVRHLREGINVQPDPPAVASELRRASFQAEQPAQQDEDLPSSGRRSRKTNRGRTEATPSKSGFRGLLVVGGGLIAVLICFLLFRSGGQLNGAHARAVADPFPAGLAPSQSSRLTIELREDGLQMAGKPLNHENAFDVLMSVLGQPSRTNQADQSTKIYTYDHHGVVLYLGNKNETDSVVLYFEAVGAARGVEEPFAGNLLISGNPVAANTQSSALRSLPRLQVTEQATNALSTFAATCDGFSLNFTYLQTPQHPQQLSLVQIYLK
jgi:hypothetical protein